MNALWCIVACLDVRYARCASYTSFDTNRPYSGAQLIGSCGFIVSVTYYAPTKKRQKTTIATTRSKQIKGT